jgi:para-nitrobenzyl esterase
MEKTIYTPCGKIKGVPSKMEGVTAYKGIRYATAKRFEYPVVTTHWEGVYDATEFGPCAIQKRAFQSEDEPGRNFYFQEFRKDVDFTYSEDCHFLNIWAPDQAKNAPVLVYIHGGAFIGGSSNERCFVEPKWPLYSCIAVTVNYRVGVFGFACFPELADEAGHTGNYALYDQLAALEWVKNNIASFGGDPNNITLMGQSAGGQSTAHILCTTKARNLVARAVMSSATMSDFPGHDPNYTDLYPHWNEILKRSGAKNFEEFRALDSQEIQTALDKYLAENFVANLSACHFVVDNKALLESPDTVFDQNDPGFTCMIGCNKDDLDSHSMIARMNEWAGKRSSPTYTYMFERNLPGDDQGAWHSADLWYWFGSLDNCWRPFTPKDQDLSNGMIRRLVAFATNGDPNLGFEGEWIPQKTQMQVTDQGLAFKNI